MQFPMCHLIVSLLVSCSVLKEYSNFSSSNGVTETVTLLLIRVMLTVARLLGLSLPSAVRAQSHRGMDSFAFCCADQFKISWMKTMLSSQLTSELFCLKSDVVNHPTTQTVLNNKDLI